MRPPPFVFVALLASAGLLTIPSCAELRHADTASDADAASGDARDGAARAQDPSSDPPNRNPPTQDASATDAAEADASDGVPRCDGPCEPEALATNLPQATALAVDANNVYFAVEGTTTGSVYQCPKTGCAGAPILLGPGFTATLRVDGGYVYWGDFQAGKVVKCAIGGCANAPTTMAPNQPGVRLVDGDGATWVWTSRAAGGSILQCSAGDCAPKPVRTGEATVVSLTVDQGNVFWVRSGPREAVVCPLGACTSPQVLGPATSYISVHAGQAFWVDGALNAVVSCPATGCANHPRAIGISDLPANPVSDGMHVYWRDDLAYTLLRCPVNGCVGAAEILARDQRAQPGGGITMDGEYVYWTIADTLYRLRK